MKLRIDLFVSGSILVRMADLLGHGQHMLIAGIAGIRVRLILGGLQLVIVLPLLRTRLRRLLAIGGGAEAVLLFFLLQGLPLGQRKLVIIRVDFVEGQKAVTIAAIIDEGGLQRRLYPRDFCEIDIAAKLFLRRRFIVEFLDPTATQHHNPGFLRVGGVDKHFISHVLLVSRAPMSRRSARNLA